MSRLNSFVKLSFKPEHDSIVVRKDKGRITGSISSINFIDKDTGQFVIYIPAFDISGYGKTEAKAEEMIKHSVEDLLNYLIKLNLKDITSELRKLGWKHDQIHKKEFSRTYIDLDGNLHDYNAKDNKVTISKLVAA